jgi:transketolase
LSRSAVAGEELAELASSDDRVVVLTADLKYSNRTADFEAVHSARFFNAGIAEQNMIGMAAGLATFGYIPYVATFASFVGLLCTEHIRTDLAYPWLKVRVLAHHSGISLGYYGTSHHATEDIGTMRSIAGLSIVAPCDTRSLRAVLRQTLDLEGPLYIRTGRGRDPDVYDDQSIKAWRFGAATWLREGPDLSVLAHGTAVAPALQAAQLLGQEGVEVSVVDMHTVKPLDLAAVRQAAAARWGMLVVEEHNTIGGLATAVADSLAELGLSARLARIGIPDEYAPVGPPTALYDHYGLTGAGIALRAKAMVSG